MKLSLAFEQKQMHMCAYQNRNVIIVFLATEFKSKNNHYATKEFYKKLKCICLLASVLLFCRNMCFTTIKICFKTLI